MKSFQVSDSVQGSTQNKHVDLLATWVSKIDIPDEAMNVCIIKSDFSNHRNRFIS